MYQRGNIARERLVDFYFYVENFTLEDMLCAKNRPVMCGYPYVTGFLFARHGRALTGESPEHAQIVGNV
jgi:hypothetical protein